MAVPAKPTLDMETILVGVACHYILCMGGCVCVCMCVHVCEGEGKKGEVHICA